jgi:hypothetical protein
VFRLPDVRRIELGWRASVIGELAAQVTLVVYAFDAGGAVLVATYVASRTLVSMAVTLGLAGVSGRVRPGLLLHRVTWLRGISRTATVVADQPLRTLALDREAFLVAVTGNSMSSAATDELVTQRLTADALADPDIDGAR